MNSHITVDLNLVAKRLAALGIRAEVRADYLSVDGSPLATRTAVWDPSLARGEGDFRPASSVDAVVAGVLGCIGLPSKDGQNAAS